jgi:hypothetical protein
MNKAILLDKIHSGYVALEAVLAPLNEAQMTTAGVEGSWSIKDIIAHLTDWHDAMLDRLQATMQGRRPGFCASDLTAEEIERINEEVYQRKLRSLMQVWSDFRSSYVEVVKTVETMKEEDLMDPYRFARVVGGSLWEVVAGDTYEHYSEHIESIQEWLTKTQ